MCLLDSLCVFRYCGTLEAGSAFPSSSLLVPPLQNPHADMQAMDRCHRIGQTRPVHVYRLATAHSVEVGGEGWGREGGRGTNQWSLRKVLGKDLERFCAAIAPLGGLTPLVAAIVILFHVFCSLLLIPLLRARFCSLTTPPLLILSPLGSLQCSPSLPSSNLPLPLPHTSYAAVL